MELVFMSQADAHVFSFCCVAHLYALFIVQRNSKWKSRVIANTAL